MVESRYRYDQHNRKAQIRHRLRWFLVGTIGTGLLIALLIFLYSLVVVQPEHASVSAPQTRVVAPNITAFSTSHFQFQASEDWREIVSEQAGVYRYRSMEGARTKHDLAVHVNPSDATLNQLKASRVQVVEINDRMLKRVGEVSESCNNAGPNVQDNDRVQFMETSFTCVAGGAVFDVLVSRKDGTPLLTFMREDGSQVNILMYYRDLRAYPDGIELSRIVDTFQVL